MFVLEEMWPYPCDESPVDDTRFLIYQFEENGYVIMDQEICKDEYISRELLTQGDFNLPEWYANKCALCSDKALPASNWWALSPLMGDAIKQGLTRLIPEGTNEYPAYSDEPAERWEVENAAFGYIIMDMVGHVLFSVPNEKLLDQSFDLITWLANELWKTYELRADTREQPCHDDCRSCAQNGLFPQERWMCPIGDTWGRAMVSLLNNLQPFPGDEIEQPIER